VGRRTLGRHRTQPNDALLTTTTFWGVPVFIADFLLHPNGFENIWIKWKSIGGVCHTIEVISYGVSYVPDNLLKYHTQNVKWVGGETATCGEDPIPFLI